MSEKKRVAIFLGGYLPAKKYGGPVTSVSNLVEQIGDQLEFYIISNDHEFGDHDRLPNIKNGWNSVGKAQVLYISEKEYTTHIFSVILQDINADVIYLSSVFYYRMNFAAIKAAKKNKIPVILAPRGEICEGAMEIGRIKKELFISLIKITKVFKDIYFHVTSDEEESAVIQYFNPDDDKIIKLPNMPCSLKKGKKIHKEKGCLSIVYLSRIVEKKNLLYAIQRVKECNQKISMDIYGPLEDENYWEKCKEEFEDKQENINIQYLGAIDPGDARNIFSNYHAFLFPTLSENYGHVIVEAITTSCPIIISKGTTPWDDINNQGGFVIDLQNIEPWAKAIDRIAEMDGKEYDLLREKTYDYAKRKLNITELSKKYSEMFAT